MLCFGFSLLGLLVTIAILSVLGTIAVNGYNAYIQRSNRELAKQALTQDVVKLEQYYNQKGNYLTENNTWPKFLIESNLYGMGGLVYTVNFAPEQALPGNSQAFDLVAEPVPGSAQADDGAGNICIDQNGTIKENSPANCGQNVSLSTNAALCQSGSVISPAVASCAYSNSCCP